MAQSIFKMLLASSSIAIGHSLQSAFVVSSSSKVRESIPLQLPSSLSKPLSPRSKSCTQLSIGVDPSHVQSIVQSASSLHIDSAQASSLDVDQEHLSALLSTMYTATAGAAKHSDSWSFLWFHGGTPDPYDNGRSLAPISPDTMSNVRDYFLPTSNEMLTKQALQDSFSKINSDMPIINSADMIQIDSVMPGAKAPPISPADTYNPQISKAEVETVARSVDLITRRIPLAVTVFALVDFYLFGATDVYSDELEDDRAIVAGEWVAQSAVRVGVAVFVTILTIIIGNLTYHPL